MSQSSTEFLAQQEQDDADLMADWPAPAIPTGTTQASVAEPLPF